MRENFFVRKVNKVWLTCPWEVNLLMGDNPRIERTNLLAEYLSRKGYDVTLWFTTFQHPDKIYIEYETKVVNYCENLHIVLLHCPVPYRKNISISRFYHLSYLAKQMESMIKDENIFPVPDVILASYPTEQSCRILERYALDHNIPIVFDVRDMWPDIFERAFPCGLRWLGRAAIYPLKVRAGKTFAGATAISGIQRPFQQWAIDYAGRELNEFDDVIFIGAKKRTYFENDLADEINYWSSLGITKETWNICFFSTLANNTLDLKTVIDAVKIAHKKYPNIRLVIGGKGDAEKKYREYVMTDSFIYMAGWLNEKQMSSIMAISKIGLLCFKNTKDFKDAWGNKVSQYFSHSIPIITSSTGYASEYLGKYGCGIVYKEGDVCDCFKVIEELILNSSKLDLMSKKAIERFNLDFDSDVVNEKFEILLNKVSTSKR